MWDYSATERGLDVVANLHNATDGHKRARAQCLAVIPGS